MDWLGNSRRNWRIAFLKFKAPPKKTALLSRKKQYAKTEGPRIIYAGVGGSPYAGQIVEIEENGMIANIKILDHCGEIVELVNVNTQDDIGNLRFIGGMRSLLHNEPVLACNKDANNEVVVGPNGGTWELSERTESSILVGAIAERRAYTKAMDDLDDIIQYKHLRRKEPLRAPLLPSEIEKEEAKVE